MNNGKWGAGWLTTLPLNSSRSDQRMNVIRDARLRWLLDHANRKIPYYRHLLKQHGVDPATITGFRDISRLPLISKNCLRDAGTGAWAQDLPEKSRYTATTSGSTGQPLELVYSFKDRLFSHAHSLQCMAAYGWRPWMRGMALGSQALPSDHLLERFRLCRWPRVDTSQAVAEWLKSYHHIRPQALHCYPSALREFCFEARRQGGLNWQPEILSAGGELYDETITPLTMEIFGKRPLVMYGSVEAGRTAMECREQNGFHVSPLAVHIELLNDGQPVSAGEPGNVYVTSLINENMPIIRYELGDVAEWVQEKCACGSSWPRIHLHQGRKSDVIHLQGNRHVPVTTLCAIVGNCGAINQFQFILRSPGHLVLRYEPSTQKSGLEQTVSDLEKTLPGIRVTLNESGQLPRTASGKVKRLIDETSAKPGGH